jgi:hypothetical protein
VTPESTQRFGFDFFLWDEFWPSLKSYLLSVSVSYASFSDLVRVDSDSNRRLGFRDFLD